MGYIRSRPSGIVRAVLVCGLAVVAASSWAAVALSAPPVRLSIVTGGTGGVYFPMGGGLAQLVSKYLPDTQATAEVTSASVDNMRLIGAKRADIARQANDLLIQDVAVIPLVQRAAVMSGFAKSLKGVDPSPWDSEMYNVADWTK